MKKALSVCIGLLIWSALVKAQQTIHIWKGTSEEHHDVVLSSYIPTDTVPSTAVIVCPGGSYHWLDVNTEGIEVAKWLNKNGIAAFVLNYRVAGIFAYVTHSRLLFRGHRQPDMFCDIQRAIQLVRQQADNWGLALNRLGVMGFSAGGHLAMASAEFASTDFLAPLGITAGVSLCPDFVALIYPVVTLSDKRFVHKRSRKGILGEYGKFNRTLRDSLSLEKHVTSDCPPVFLVNCVDDPVVKYGNSELLDSALTVHGVPHKYIQYQTGGHGFGTREDKGTAESRRWKEEFLDWLNSL